MGQSIRPKAKAHVISKARGAVRRDAGELLVETTGSCAVSHSTISHLRADQLSANYRGAFRPHAPLKASGSASGVDWIASRNHLIITGREYSHLCSSPHMAPTRESSCQRGMPLCIRRE
jgi:hypothetical protein